MVFSGVVIPVILIIFGWIMWKHPPKKVNKICGYRTKRSMTNMDTWKFAHEYCGKLWWKLGWIMLILSVVVHTVFHDCSHGEATEPVGIVLCYIQAAVLLVSIVLTENALKKNFFCRQKNTNKLV